MIIALLTVIFQWTAITLESLVHSTGELLENAYVGKEIGEFFVVSSIREDAYGYTHILLIPTSSALGSYNPANIIHGRSGCGGSIGASAGLCHFFSFRVYTSITHSFQFVPSHPNVGLCVSITANWVYACSSCGRHLGSGSGTFPGCGVPHS
ncbi:MAG: hypothetical protein FWE44_05825 [Defluviitaleaceae bacterium]|nr:hypothetical protein [Defluviitaleaceae bacterium]